MAITSVAATPQVARTTTASPAVVAAASHVTGNSAIPTTFSRTPVAASTATPSTATAMRTAAAQATTGVPAATTTGGTLRVGSQAVTNAQQGVAAINNVSSFINTAGAQSTGTQHTVQNAIQQLASFAQSKMDTVKANIQALMSSEGGEMNAAKLQAYSQEMSSYETMMQMAAKLQEQEDQAIKIWVRP